MGHHESRRLGMRKGFKAQAVGVLTYLRFIQVYTLSDEFKFRLRKVVLNVYC